MKTTRTMTRRTFRSLCVALFGRDTIANSWIAYRDETTGEWRAERSGSVYAIVGGKLDLVQA